MAGAAGAANTAVRSLLGVLGTTSVFLAAGFGIRAAITQITEFERQMSAVKAISGATGEEFELLTMRARELGGSTVFTATQAAEGLKFFAQAGFSVQESMQAVGAALDLAIIGMTDLGTASDITANVIRGFNLAASEAGRVADVLAFTASNTNTNVIQLGQALSFVAPVAKGLNVPLEDTSIALGVLSDAGLKGQRAGTGLRGIFQKLVNPSEKARKIIESFKISMEDVNPAIHGVRGAIENLSPVLAGPDGAANAMAIFMQRAGPAALILNQLKDRFDDLAERIKESEGVAKEMAAIMQDNLWGAAKILTSALTETVLQLGDAGLTGVMKTVLRETALLVQAFNGTLDAADKANEKYIAWAGTLKVVAAAAGGAGLTMILLGLAKAATLAISALVGFALANPFTALILGASALIGYLVSVRDEMLLISGHEVSIQGLATVLSADLTEAVKGLNTEILGTNTSLDGMNEKLGIPTTKAALIENLILSFMWLKKVLEEINVRIENLFVKFAKFAGFTKLAGLGERKETPFGDLSAEAAGATSQLLGRAAEASKTRAATLKAEEERVAALKKRYEELLAGGSGVDPGLLSDIEEAIAESSSVATSGARELRTEIAALEASVNPYVAALQAYEKNTLLVTEAMAKFPKEAERWIELQGRVNDSFTEMINQADQAANQDLVALRNAAASLAGAMDPSVAVTNELNERLDLLAKLANSGDVELMKLAETLRGPVVEAAELAKEKLIDPSLLEGLEGMKAGALAAFAELGGGALNEFSVVKTGLVGIFSAAGDALSEFVTTGKTDIQDLSRTIILEISKAMAKFALMQALKGLQGLGGASGGGVGGFISQIATGLLTTRASGGAVGPGKSFLVGEERPEIFTPPTAGSITPMDSGMFNPQVNVQVINVDDPDSVPRAMATKEGDRAIVNAIQRNSAKLRSLI